MINLLGNLAGRETVREVARTLAPAGVPVLPLKGALLQAVGCADPRARPMLDVDLLVPAGAFDRASERLREAGWVQREPGLAETVFVRANRPVALDLHHRVYAYARYGPTAEAVLERARPDREAFGVEVLLPDPRDLYAHLVGHFAKDRRDERQGEKLHDFERVAERYALSSSAVAAWLTQEGLGRAARYTLGIVRDHAGDRFAGEVLAQLPPDRLGDVLARLARAAVARGRQPFKPAAVPVALLDRSLWASAASLATHARAAVARELRDRR